MEDQDATIDLTEDKPHSNDEPQCKISHFFVQPPSAEILAEIQDEDGVAEDAVDEEGTERSILDQVFTGDKPVFLRMDEKAGAENSLINKAKEIGVYEKGMKRFKIVKAVDAYWIRKVSIS